MPSFYSHKDVAKLEHLMRDKPLSEREVGAQLINETVAYEAVFAAVNPCFIDLARTHDDKKAAVIATTV